MHAKSGGRSRAAAKRCTGVPAAGWRRIPGRGPDPRDPAPGSASVRRRQPSLHVLFFSCFFVTISVHFPPTQSIKKADPENSAVRIKPDRWPKGAPKAFFLPSKANECLRILHSPHSQKTVVSMHTHGSTVSDANKGTLLPVNRKVIQVPRTIIICI